MKKREFIVVFVLFLLFILGMILTHHTFLGVQDEGHLQATLFNNEPINYMTSYPLAVMGGHLYAHFPSVQWYSVILTSYTVFIAYVLSLYIASIHFLHKGMTLFYKMLLLFFSLALIAYTLLEVDVTSPTLLLIVLAVPLIKERQILFWVLFWIASFLREQILWSVLPLIVLAYLMQVEKSYFTPKRFGIIAVLLLGILFNHFSYKLDKTYDKWMDFTEARAYYTDFGGVKTKGILTSDEYYLAKGWWLADLDLYPYKKIQKAAGSTLDIVKERFLYEHPKSQIKHIFLHHPSLYLLLFFSFLMVFFYKSWIKIFGYLGFFLGLIVLLMVKDVERVTLPVLLMWWALIGTDLWYMLRSRFQWIAYGLLVFVLGWVNYYIIETLPLERITHYQQKEALAHEMKSLIEKNHMELEITSGFPSSWNRLIEALMQNHLFDEKQWISYSKDLFLSGWLTRVPLLYKQHHISFGGVKRKYAHYHDWLIQPHSGIIGSKGERAYSSISCRQFNAYV